MANTQNPFGAMTPEQKNGATIALTQALSWLNQPAGTTVLQASSASAGNGAAATRKARGPNKKTLQQAGHEGGLATAAKRGRKPRAANALANQS